MLSLLFAVLFDGSQSRFHLSVRQREDVRPMAAVEFVRPYRLGSDVHFCSEGSAEDPALDSLDGAESVVVLDNLRQLDIVPLERVNHADCIVIVFHYFHSVSLSFDYRRKYSLIFSFHQIFNI